MRYVRLVLSFAFFVPAFTIIGVWNWGGYWPGWVAGGLVGLFFGLVFGGARGKWLDVFYPPGPGDDGAAEE
jgi:hypothetical protein